MKLPKLLIILSIFFLSFAATIAIDSWKTPVPEPFIQGFSPTPTPVTLVLPANELTSTLISASGAIHRIPWDQTQPIPATAGATLYQADEISTAEKSQASFQITASISGHMAENTDIILGSLLPQRVTLQQRTGTATYITTDSQNPLSIKSLSSLLQLDEGAATIKIDGQIISIHIEKGTAKLAYTNEQNNADVWRLQTNDSAIINNQTGNVKTTGDLLSTIDQ